MSWGRIDDRLPMSVKIRGLADPGAVGDRAKRQRNEALGHWLQVLAWVSGERTDGFVTADILDLFGTEASAERPPSKRPVREARTKRATPAPKLEARDIGGILAGLPELRISSETSSAEADAAFGEVATFDRCPIFVGRFHGQSPWERHSSGDELLHVLDGEVDVTILTDDGPVHRTLRAGSVFVCPRGLWHRQLARSGATGLYATPRPTDISFADDPRLDA